MSERMVAIANSEPEIGFNVLSLKYYLLDGKVCDKCQTKTNDWKLMCLCHHIICEQCSNANNNNSCVVCNTQFDPQLHVSSVGFMAKTLLQLEKFVYYITGLEKGTIQSIHPDEVFDQKFLDNVKEFINNIPNADDAIQEETVETDVIELQTNLNRRTSESSRSNVSSVFVHTNDILMHDVENTDNIYNLSPNDSDKQTNLTCSASVSSMDIFDHSQDIELEEEENERSDTETILNRNNEQINENTNDQNDNTDVSSNNSSEIDDVIIGTPERTLNCPITLTYTGVKTDAEINIIKQMVFMLNLQAEIKWTPDITHLVAVVDDKDRCPPTVKFLNAILNNCFIVKFQWVIDCVNKKSLLPEEQYMALNIHGQASPLISVKVGLGSIESPLKWCMNCGLYFHNSMRLDYAFEYLIDMAKKAGFVVYNKLEDFNDSKLKMRVILCNSRSEDEKKQLCDVKLIMGWIHNYKAVPLSFDWLVDCITCYEFVPFKIEYQLFPMERNYVISEEMDESLFEFSKES